MGTGAPVDLFFEPQEGDFSFPGGTVSGQSFIPRVFSDDI